MSSDEDENLKKEYASCQQIGELVRDFSDSLVPFVQGGLQKIRINRIMVISNL